MKKQPTFSKSIMIDYFEVVFIAKLKRLPI